MLHVRDNGYHALKAVGIMSYTSETIYTRGKRERVLQSSRGSGQVLWPCTGRNMTFPPSTSLPVMGEIAGVNTASLGGYLRS